MKIYTRRGDTGQTDLFDGSRVLKCELRVETYGTVDEANAVLGHCARLAQNPLQPRILRIQNQLFDVGADLATPTRETARTAKVPAVSLEHVAELEAWIDEADQQLPPLRSFILPGGSELACWLHIARTTVRRAERICIHLAQQQPVNPTIITYLNRLSDLLFTWSRLANHQAGTPDTPWTKAPPPNTPAPQASEPSQP